MSRSASKGVRRSRRRFLKVAGALGIGTLGVAIWQKDEVNRLVVERRDLRLPRWTADGFLVAQLSDLHLSTASAFARARMALNMAIAEKPDVIVITGDFADSMSSPKLTYLRQFLDLLSGSPVPVLGIMGNHDYWTPFVSNQISLMKNTPNFVFLRNETHEIRGVNFYGIDDGVAGRDRHDRMGPTADQNTIALFHEPDFVDRVDRRCSLMLAGHSHGGQCCLPGGWHLYTPRGARRYVRGYYEDAAVPLYVTRGVGAIGIEKRLFCPPEVSLLRLLKA